MESADKLTAMRGECGMSYLNGSGCRRLSIVYAMNVGDVQTHIHTHEYMNTYEYVCIMSTDIV